MKVAQHEVLGLALLNTAASPGQRRSPVSLGQFRFKLTRMRTLLR
jgi:hypothetical protein